MADKPQPSAGGLTSTLPLAGKEGVALEPATVIEQARKAALALKDVIDKKPKPVIVNGKRYLEYEDWQTLARFYGYTVETGESEEIWREGKLLGYKAKAFVYQNGVKVGGAEASCLRDESTWKYKPEFQLKSMAQTRAGAKSLRNVLAWVAILAGYSPTPAEEIVENPEKAETQEVAIPKQAGVKCPECGAVGRYHAKGCSLAQMKMEE